MDRDDDDFWSFSSWSSRDRSDDEKEEDKWAGDLIAYGIQDRWPDEGEAQAYPLDHERYRVRLYHNQSFTDRDYFMGQINYLSDPKIIEQFFRREYKSSPEPDNYLVFGHRAERLSLSLSAERRLNDFYTAVDRLPELTLDFRRQRIGQSPFFYQGETVGGYLEKNWESNLTNASDYAAGRLHTEHRLYYPTKQAGFLNLIPRVGWRGTAYSATKEDVTNVVTTIVVGTNGVLRTNTASRVTAREMDAEFRSYPELGLETSFKAFKVWQTHPGDIINNVRHIVEPYADYTLAPEPNVTPDRLYDFDAIDTLDRLNQVQLGLRNKIQTQRFGRLPSRPHTVADLINADVWIIYRLDPRENENTFSNVCWDVRSTPFPWMELKVDGAYDPYTNQVETLNTRLSLNDRTLWRYYIEHRFARDDNSLLNSALTLTPFAAWEYSAFVRHQLETSTLEAWGLSVQRRRECLTYKVGCEFEDDDYSFWVKFWFSQFPKVRLDVGL